MNARNLICWAVVLVGFFGLLFWGTTRPIKMVRWQNTTWSRMWTRIDQARLPGSVPEEEEEENPPPPPIPATMTREQAAEVIKISALVNHAGAIIPRLQPAVRVSPWPVKDLDELEPGDSRFTAPPDVPEDFDWPWYNGKPLTLIAQLNMAEVLEHDLTQRLPQSGWLCFFYADNIKPPPLGMSPADRDAWRVVYFDGDPESLKRMLPPEKEPDKYPPCFVRFWQEWTLPDLTEEPDLIWEKEQLFFYGDLCTALTGRPEESGWHHLLGYAQNVGGPMPAACELVTQGVTVTYETDFDDPKIKAKVAKADEWVLLFQVELDALMTLGVKTEDALDSLWSMYGATGRIYYWIRADDLQKRDFSKVWLQRQGYFDSDELDEEYEDDEDDGD